MSADVAMTKKGYGEMAITATLAGPIFNVAVGQFSANLVALLNNSKGGDITKRYIVFSLFDNDHNINLGAVLPLTIIVGSIIVTIMVLVNALINRF